jgi:CheY-like chemotaxis protein
VVRGAMAAERGACVYRRGLAAHERPRAGRQLRPDLPVLFTTGYAQDAMFQQGELDPNTELLTKPFNRTQLAERVRHLLDA